MQGVWVPSLFTKLKEKMVFDFLDVGSRENTRESVVGQTSVQLMGPGGKATGQTHWTHLCSFFFQGH